MRVETGAEISQIAEMAKPGIPVKRPIRREQPLIINPFPEKQPAPPEPVRTAPRVPVPA